MLREILNKFSGRQLTAIILAAILAPSAVTAAVSFQAVAIVDPNTGKQSFVDNSRRLSVNDPIAGYRNNPANIVDIALAIVDFDACETSYQYAVPAGKALILTAISGYEALNDLNALPYAGYELFDGAGCTGNLLTQHFTSLTSASPEAPVAVDLGAGIAVKSGKTVSVFSLNSYSDIYLHGYLVPASAAPALASAEEPRPITAAQAAAQLKHLQQR